MTTPTHTILNDPASGSPAQQPPIIINNPSPTPPSPNASQYFTAEQVEAIRQQEKDKLYDKLSKQDDLINGFKTQLETLNADKQQRDAAIAKAQSDAEEARRREEESKLTAQQIVDQRETEMKRQQEEFQRNMDFKIAAMQKEQDFLRLQSFIQRRVAEEMKNDTIIPDLVEYIGGETEEEVEASITKAKEKTANIVNGAAGLSSGTPNPGGVSPTGGPSGPLDSITGPRQYSKEEIAAMPMSEYAKFRATSGLDRAGTGQGMFT